MTNTDPNSNNDTLKVLKTLTEFPKDGFSKTKAFIIRLNNFMREKDNMSKMTFELIKGGLMKDIKIHPSDFFLASNIIVITCSCASLFKFKKYTTKFFGFLSFLMLKSLILDPINVRLNYKHIALNEIDMISQEVRLLYQFYFPNDPVISKLKEKCQEYHRNLINRRKIKEKYGN